MINRKISAKISLIICSVCSVLLVVMLFSMPSFFGWFYTVLRGDSEYSAEVIRTVVTAFYFCAPFAAAALYSMIRMLDNVLKDRTFILSNVKYLRVISWCCYAVTIVTVVFGIKYIPLFIISFTMAVTGTLLRVMKNILHSAVELREENDLTI